jgi:hypothetical protein
MVQTVESASILFLFVRPAASTAFLRFHSFGRRFSLSGE